MQQRYQSSSDYSALLGAVSRRLRRGLQPSKRDFLVREGWNFGARQVEIWFRSRGCHYFLHGGCTMCNYGYSKVGQPMELALFVGRALATVTLDASTNLLISPSGSFLDPWEVPPSARDAILADVATRPWRQFIFETQANFVTEAALSEVLAGIAGRSLKVAIGLESFDEAIRKLSINKDLPQALFLEAIRTTAALKVQTSVNVVIGAPFLDPARQIQDAIQSAVQLAALVVDEIFLFPINVKVGTLVEWLWRKGFYTPPSLWALLHVVLTVPDDVRSRLSFAWHKEYYVEFADVAGKVLHRPGAVESFQIEMDEAARLLDSFLMTRDISALRAFTVKSRGYQQWLDALAVTHSPLDHGALVDVLVTDVLGPEFRVQNDHEVERFVGDLSSLATPAPALVAGSGDGH